MSLQGEPVNPQLIISSTDQDFSYWLSRPYSNPELRDRSRRPDVLIVPSENAPGHNGPAFSSETPELFEFLRSGAPSGIDVEVPVTDEEYREVVLHGILLVLGCFVVTSIAAPVIAQLIANYIQKRIGEKEKDATVRFQMTVVEPDGTAKKLEYQGPASLFEQKVLVHIKAKYLPGCERQPQNDHADNA
jgi:hypothetical protein